MFFELEVIKGKAKNKTSTRNGRSMLAIRIRDVPKSMQKALRYWLACRFGGPEDNILRMQGERAHVALAGNVLSFFRSCGLNVKIVRKRNCHTWTKFHVLE